MANFTENIGVYRCPSVVLFFFHECFQPSASSQKDRGVFWPDVGGQCRLRCFCATDTTKSGLRQFAYLWWNFSASITSPRGSTCENSCYHHINLALAEASFLRADSFGQGADLFEIEFVPIGEDDGVTEATRYAYRMGKYEISEGMINVANRLSASQGNSLDITQSSRGDNKPATMVTWHEAARFVNWLNIDAGSLPAYNFDKQNNLQLWEPSDEGYDPYNLVRNKFATYLLPTSAEWLKSGYYNPMTDSYSLYPTGQDAQPRSVGSGTEPGTAVWDECQICGPADITLARSPSVYGTVGQGGNVFEWSEAYGQSDERSPFIAPFLRDRFLNKRVLRGGAWVRLDPGSDFLNIRSFFLADATSEDTFSGFRVASIAIPEPSTITLLICSGILLVYRRNFAGI